MPNQSTIEAIVEAIRKSELPQSETQIIATKVLSLNAKNAAADLFDILIHHPGEIVTTNLLSLFHELAIRSPEWVRILHKSVKKRGRCPKPLVSTMRAMLTAENERLAHGVRSIRDLLGDFERIIDEPVVQEQVERNAFGEVVIKKKTQWFGSGKSRATIPITTDLSDIQRMEALASLLGGITDKPDELYLDFSDVEHVYVVGLAALRAWCDKLSIVPEVVNVSETTQRYLEEIGFIDTVHSTRNSSEKHYAMAIEQITMESQPEAIACRIVEIIDHHMPLPRKTRSGLIVVFAELVENIQRHAGMTTTAFACAQVYPQKRKLTICIVDTGMGIRNSIFSSSNESLIIRVKDGESPVRLACAPLITSKPDKHSGYGLYVASELIIRNGGTFRIFSGNEIFTCYRKSWQRKENLRFVSRGWDGTWIAMIVDLDGLLPVEDVYSILPPIPGVELEDYFLT